MKRNLKESTSIDILNRREMLVLMGRQPLLRQQVVGMDRTDLTLGRLSQAVWSARHRRKARISWMRSSTVPTSVRILQTIR
jgi:hypothetical protein